MMTNTDQLARAQSALVAGSLAALLLMGSHALAQPPYAAPSEVASPTPAAEPVLPTPPSFGECVNLPEGCPFPLDAPCSVPDPVPPPPPCTKSGLSDEAIGLQPIPPRPALIFETNDYFLSPGFLSQGIELPTGAVWRPSIWVFGEERFAVQYFDNQTSTNVAEVVNRLNLFTQLNLSGTERILWGVRPFDHEVQNKRRYVSYDFTDGRYIDGWNGYVETLFFEGDFSSIFANLDPYDTKWLDYGFSVGRQPYLLQYGALVNTNAIDAFTVTRNTIYGHGILNSRITGMFAWNRIHRNENEANYIYIPKARLYGLFTETDFKFNTVDADFCYINSADSGNSFHIGVSSSQRVPTMWQEYNSVLQALTSFPVSGETPATGRGVLLIHQLSWTPPDSENVVYVIGFWAIDQFTSATRSVEVGGPLAPVAGILFANPQLGQYGAPLNTEATDAAGGSIGYQMLLDGLKRQVIFELGGRKDTNGIDQGQIGLGARYLQAMGQHWILLLDSFVTKQEGIGACGVGARIELQAKF